MYRILLIALLILPTVVRGYDLAPEDGLWWNPAESGRGWTFETQNNITVVTHYTYRTDGFPTFFTTSAVWDPIRHELIGPVFWATFGPCIGCPYVAPTNQNIGNAIFRFTSRFSGTITYPNGTVIPIQKYQFMYADPKAYLKGVWATTWVDQQLGSFSHFIQFDTNCATCGAANPYSVIGTVRITEAFGRPAVGQLIPNSGNQFQVLIDSESDYWDFYYVAAEKDGWRGFACTRLKTAPYPTGPADCSGLMFGLRVVPEAGLAGFLGAKTAGSTGAVRRADTQSKLQTVPKEWRGVVTSWEPLVREIDAAR
jgi:hypothetical protein